MATTDGSMIEIDVHDPRWLEFVACRSDASVFHHPAWATLLRDCYGFTPRVLAMLGDRGRIQAGLPVMEVSRPFGDRRWVSLPFTDYCPPLALPDTPADHLLDEVLSRLSDNGVRELEVRSALPRHRAVYPGASAVRHTLPLTAPVDELYGRVSKMHRRNIRKAEQAGVLITRGQDTADVEAFYRLHVMTRRRLGVPVQPRRFFRLLTEHLLRANLGFVLSAYLNETPVAAAVFLAWNDVLIYKYGASDPRFWHQRPNNLLFWTAIQTAAAEGFRTLDWGRTDLDDRGLREFKAGWGAKEEPLVYSVIAGAPPRRTAARSPQAMKTLIRHSPGWVCRLIGECLYRYAA